MENEGREGFNLQAMPPGVGPTLAIITIVFGLLSRSLGPYFAVVAIALLLALVYDLLKLIYTFLKVLATKRPEGTSFFDALYYEIGHGDWSRSGFGLGVVLLVTGIGMVLYSPIFPQTPDLETALIKNPIAAAGTSLAAVAIILVYSGVKGIVKKSLFKGFSYEEPEVKKMKAEMMSAFKQGRTMDAINLFKMDLKSLTDQFSEANALKFDFSREEKELAGIAAVFKKAETYCKDGAMREADLELNDAKRQYENLRPKISSKLRAYGKVKEHIAGLKKLAKEIEDGIRSCSKSGIKAADEEEAYKKLDMNRSLLASESFWRDDNYKEAIGELEKLEEEYRRIRTNVSSKLARYNELLGRKFQCLKCGGAMNLTLSSCPSCRTKPSEAILVSMSGSLKKLEDSTKNIENAKWLMTFDSEEEGFEEIQIALANITKQVENGEYDRATSLLISTKASQDALIAEMNEKFELYEKMAGRISELKKHSLETRTASEQLAKDSVDIRAEEDAYKKASESSSQDMIEGLCKSGSFSEAMERIEKAISEYDRLKELLAKKAAAYKDVSEVLAELESDYTNALSVISQVKAKKVDVSEEEAVLSKIKIDDLRKRAKTITPESEVEIREAHKRTFGALASLEKKSEIFGRLEGMVSALEEKMKEYSGLLERCTAFKLDTEEERKKCSIVNMDAIKKRYGSGDSSDSLRKDLEKSLDAVQWSIASMTDKLASIEDSPKWLEAIKTAMRDTDMVEIGSLGPVPEEWRSWAVGRYVDTNKDDAFVVYQNKLIKTMSTKDKSTFEMFLNGMRSSGKIKGCAIFDDRGIVIASAISDLKDQIPVGGFAATAVDCAKNLARISGVGKETQLVIGGDDYKTIITEAGMGLFLLCLVRPKDNVSFTSIFISENLEKLKKQMG